MQRLIIKQLMIVSLMAALGIADTFTNRQNGEVLHGYKMSKTEGAETFVQTDANGLMKLNLAQWDHQADQKGRKNEVVIMTIEGPIMYEVVAKAFEETLPKIADSGPLLIVLELDTPGGSVNLCQRMCAILTKLDDTNVVAYIKGGRHGGAISAGAVLSLACDRIYMANNTIIGAATMVTQGHDGKMKGMKEEYGEVYGEKVDSLWRAYVASLAEGNNRAGIFARAMVDKNIEVVEVKEKEQRKFIDPVNKRSEHRLVKTWSKKGSLLTMTAGEAYECGYNEGIVDTRQELLRAENCENAKVVINNTLKNALTSYKRAESSVLRIRNRVDLKAKSWENVRYRAEALKILRDYRKEIKTLLKLAKEYSDLNLDVIAIENDLNTVEALIIDIKRSSRRR